MQHYVPKDAIKFLRIHGCPRVTEASLATMRSRRGGPQYRKNGRYVLYPEPSLIAWARSRLTGLRDSTSQNRAPTSGGVFDLPFSEDDKINYCDSDPHFDEITRLEEAQFNDETIVDDMLKAFDYHKTLNKTKS